MYYNHGSKRATFKSSDFRYTDSNVDKDGKKAKEVYPSNESLCHVWASEQVLRGRTGNMFFEKGVIYSYGYHYKAAFIHSNKDKKLVLINYKTYSNSTTAQLYEIKKAIKHLEYLSVPDVAPESDHDDNLEYLNEQIATHLENIFKRRGYSGEESLVEAIKAFNQYCSFFKLKQSIELDDDTLALVQACIKEREEKCGIRDANRKLIEANRINKLKLEHRDAIAQLEGEFPSYLDAWESDKISDYDLRRKTYYQVRVKGPFGHTKRIDLPINLEQYRERIESKLEIKYLNQLTDFRDFKINHIDSYFKIGDIELDNRSDYSLLRVKNNIVQTSNGADVPLDHALRLLKMILKGNAKNGERVGLYTLGSVDDDLKGDKTIQIGCHKILLSEAVKVLRPYMLELLK